MSNIKQRLEYLRQQIKEEKISYGEIAELQSLANYIDKGDTELLHWAGVPENKKCDCNLNYGNKELKGSHDIDCNIRKNETWHAFQNFLSFLSIEETNKVRRNIIAIQKTLFLNK